MGPSCSTMGESGRPHSHRADLRDSAHQPFGPNVRRIVERLGK